MSLTDLAELDGAPLIEAIDRTVSQDWNLLCWSPFRGGRLMPISDAAHFEDFARAFAHNPLLAALKTGEWAVRASRIDNEGGWSGAELVTIPAVFWSSAEFIVYREPPLLVEELPQTRMPLRRTLDGKSGSAVRFANPTVHREHAGWKPTRRGKAKRAMTRSGEMMEARRQLLSEAKLDASMPMKKQHQLVLSELGIKGAAPRGYGYQTFLNLMNRKPEASQIF